MRLKIRPLHKIPEGYESDDKQWQFFKYKPENEWFVYRTPYRDDEAVDPYFYNGYPTLKSLIEAVEHDMDYPLSQSTKPL